MKVRKNLTKTMMLSLTMFPVDVFSASQQTKQLIQNTLSKYCITKDKTLCNTPYEGKYELGYTFCVCNDGMIWNETERKCEYCNSGTYYAKSIKTNKCKQCSAGTYQDETGKAACKQCSAGTYQDETGSTGCKNCDEKQCMTSDAGATSCKSKCSGSTPYCNESGKCIECREDSDCLSAEQRCKVNKYKENRIINLPLLDKSDLTVSSPLTASALQQTASVDSYITTMSANSSSNSEDTCKYYCNSYNTCVKKIKNNGCSKDDPFCDRAQKPGKPEKGHNPDFDKKLPGNEGGRLPLPGSGGGGGGGRGFGGGGRGKF